MICLKIHAFGPGMFKIELPTRKDATFGLYYAIDKKTSHEFSLEDDGMILVQTADIQEVEKIKKAAEEHLNNL